MGKFHFILILSLLGVVVFTTHAQTCSIDYTRLNACVDLLSGAVRGIVGPKDACCPTLEGLGGFESARCLCANIKAKGLKVSVVMPKALEALRDYCGKYPPREFKCRA
ncbi:hypothetical protein ACHQM5_018015 [Ranunculus cassubicifolius]